MVPQYTTKELYNVMYACMCHISRVLPSKTNLTPLHKSLHSEKVCVAVLQAVNKTMGSNNWPWRPHQTQVPSWQNKKGKGRGAIISLQQVTRECQLLLSEWAEIFWWGHLNVQVHHELIKKGFKVNTWYGWWSLFNSTSILYKPFKRARKGI